VDQNALTDNLFELDYALEDMPKFDVPTDLEKAIQNGQVLDALHALQSHERIVFTRDGQAVAVYVNHPTKEGKMKPEKMFNRLPKEGDAE
jgi:tRNA pseudouridine55 synthase